MRAEDVVRAARAYVGRPWRHQARGESGAVDCLGLLVCVARDLGIPHEDGRAYPRRPDGVTFMAELRRQLVRVRKRDARPGDVVAMLASEHASPGHLGILTEGGMIEASALRRKVVERAMDEDTWRSVVGVFRLPGVEA